MKEWRSKKRNSEAGLLTQICVWAPERCADLVRQICERVAEPTERGGSLRSALSYQVNRRRTVNAVWQGRTWRAEQDSPTGPYWHQRPLGGRILGNCNKIELSPNQAFELQGLLKDATDAVMTKWIKKNKLEGLLVDETGVMTGPDETSDERHPKNDDGFAVNEARIAMAVMEEGKRSPNAPAGEPNIFYFDGCGNLPSYCRVAHFEFVGRVKFAFVHVGNGGTIPTNVFANLATAARQRFYPEVPPEAFDWYDVAGCIDHDFNTEALSAPGTFCKVALDHSNGVYSNPVWANAEFADREECILRHMIAEFTWDQNQGDHADGI